MDSASDPATLQTNPAPTPAEPPGPNQKSRKKIYIIGATTGLVLIGFAVFGWWHFIHKPNQKNQTLATTKSINMSQTGGTASSLPGLQLDPSKNYGNKYANGVLPVGDGKYSTTTPKVGYVYVCSGYAQNIQTQAGGAGKRGPWFSSDGTTYELNKKLHVEGSVNWQSQFSNQVSGATRTISTNDLPSDPTGIFPIRATDPAYAYDKNPNSIKAQSLTYSLTTGPTYSDTPHCMGGQSGVMLSGVALFNGFDAGGRDAGAWEVQDNCDGHPESQGEYHYHTLSSCIKDISVKTVIGYALDGYPITGPQISSNNILTTADLDECHGLTSAIIMDGKTVTSYHYVMTQDFPYSVSCFRSTPIDPPGLKPLPH